MNPFWRSYFSKGLKPPTSYAFLVNFVWCPSFLLTEVIEKLQTRIQGPENRAEYQWIPDWSSNECASLSMNKAYSGGSKIFLFSPLPGEMIQFDTNTVLFKWVETINYKAFSIPLSSLPQPMLTFTSLFMARAGAFGSFCSLWKGGRSRVGISSVTMLQSSGNENKHKVS